MKRISSVVAILFGVSIFMLMGTAQSEAQGPDLKPKEPKTDSFLATNPNLVGTLAFINDSLVAKLRFIGQHNLAGQVLMGKSILHVGEDRSGRHRKLVRFETHVLEDMANASDSPRSHLSIATALQDDLNVGAASSSGDYVLVPCKTGKKCVENRLILSNSYDQAPSSLPGLGTLMTRVWAPPSVLVIGPFPQGQASSMVPVVQYLLSR